MQVDVILLCFGILDLHCDIIPESNLLHITFANCVSGNEEVRVAILAALGAWLSRVASSSPAECVKFFSLGLKEKDTLRRAHLRCLRLAFQNSDILTEVCTLLRRIDD